MPRLDPREVFCASSAYAQSLTDADFWDHVFVQEGMDEDDWGYGEANHGGMDEFLTEEACTICGAVGACAWDAEGLPLIHPIPREEHNGYRG